MELFTILLVVFGYLLVGYLWTMTFIHRLTEGWWYRTDSYGNHVPNFKMGVGTALFLTLAWPIHIVTSLIIIVGSTFFSGDFWKRLYRIKD